MFPEVDTHIYREMDPLIKKESEERLPCADGSATEDLGSKSSQPSDQQSETLNLTKVFTFTLHFNFQSSFAHLQHELCAANEQWRRRRRNASDPESSPFSSLKSCHQVNQTLALKPSEPMHFEEN